MITNNKLFNDRALEIKKAKTIAIISHMNPDGDTLGSATALYKALVNLGGKIVHLYCNNEIEYKYVFIPNADKFNTQSLLNEPYDLAIAVDNSSYERLGEVRNIFKKAKRNIQIDHHISNDKYAKNLNVLIASAANCENIANLIFVLEKTFNKKLMDNEIGRSLYIGLITDTGSFAFSSVTEDTFKIAAKLKQLGIDTAELHSRFISSLPLSTFRLKQRCLNNARFFLDNQLVISVFSKKDFEDTNTTMAATDGLIQNLINIEEVKVAVLLTEVDEYRYKASIRTKTGYDSNDIAGVFNGGGHEQASGCSIAGHIEDIKDKLIKVVSDRI